MNKIVVSSTKNKQVIDITEEVNQYLKKKELNSGLCYLFVLHTTASLTVCDLDPGTDLDLLDALDKMVPRLAYKHPHDPGHVGDHIMSSIIGASVVLPFEQSKLELGTWQRV